MNNVKTNLKGVATSMADSQDNPILTHEAAAILGVGPQRVRQLSDSGELPARRSSGGVRLFLREDVERLAARRVRKLISKRDGK